jgi:hypothetical protein
MDTNITVSLNHTLQILHIKSSFHRNTLYSSHRELNWTVDLSYNSHCRYYSPSLNWKLTSLYFTHLSLSLLIVNFWTLSLNWKLSPQIRRCLLQLRISRGCLPLRALSKWASVSPINPWTDTQKKTAFYIVADVMHCGCVMSMWNTEVTLPLLTDAWSKCLQLSHSNGKCVYLSTA